MMRRRHCRDTVALNAPVARSLTRINARAPAPGRHTRSMPSPTRVDRAAARRAQVTRPDARATVRAFRYRGVDDFEGRARRHCAHLRQVRGAHACARARLRHDVRPARARRRDDAVVHAGRPAVGLRHAEPCVRDARERPDRQADGARARADPCAQAVGLRRLHPAQRRGVRVRAERRTGAALRERPRVPGSAPATACTSTALSGTCT